MSNELRSNLCCEAQASLLQGEGTTVCDSSSPHGTRRSETVEHYWRLYLEQGKRSKRIRSRDVLSPGYIDGLRNAASPGGEPRKRGLGHTKPGPLNTLMILRLEDIDAGRLQAWYDEQCTRGRAQADRSLMMFRGFLRWCASLPDLHLAAINAMNAARSLAPRKITSLLQPSAVVIQPSELHDWWKAVTQLPDQRVSVYLRALVMTGQNSQAMLNLQWKDVRSGWLNEGTFRCHLYDRHSVPLTDEFVRMIRTLPEKSEFVFAGLGKTGRITNRRAGFQKSLQLAGLQPLPLSALRRTFILLAEMAGMPAAAVAQFTQSSDYCRRKRYLYFRLTDLRDHVSNVESLIKQLVEKRSLV
jgi:hypothetical protein